PGAGPGFRRARGTRRPPFVPPPGWGRNPPPSGRRYLASAGARKLSFATILRLFVHSRPFGTVLAAGSTPRGRGPPCSGGPSGHELARGGFGDDGAPADPEVEDASKLLLGHVAGEPREHGRALPRGPVELDREPSGHDAREVSEDAPSGHVRQ